MKTNQIAINALAEISHGAHTNCHENTIKILMRIAECALKEIANNNLESAGLYGRSIERWWDGFYGNFTPHQTALMTPPEIAILVTNKSRQG